MDFCSMKRKELQSLCKKNGISANLSNVEMAARLAAVHQVKKQKNFKSCLKNLEIGVCSDDDESDRVKIKGGKRVRFSPENETFEFEKTDPREMRLLARKTRALAQNRDLVDESLSNVEGELEESHMVGCLEEAVRRNLRRKSMVKSKVGFGCEGAGNEVKNVEKENARRRLRLRSRRVEEKDVGAALLSPCVEKKAKRGRKGHDTVDREDVSLDKTADHVGNACMVTQRSLRSTAITAENLGETGGGVVDGVVERNDLVKKDLNEKGENVVQVLRRSVRCREKAKGGVLSSVSKGQVDNLSSNDSATKNHEYKCVQMALDNRKRKRVGKKAANRKHQLFEEVSYGPVDQQNGNMEKSVDDDSSVRRRLENRDVVIEGLGKGDVEVNGLADKCLTRKSTCRRTMNDEMGGSSIPVQAVRRSTRQRGKQKVDASLSEQVADDVPEIADDTSLNDNQKSQLVSEASETRDTIMEKADTVMTDGSSGEQTIVGGADPDHSVEEKMNEELEGLHHTTLGSTSTEQRNEKLDWASLISANNSEQYCVAYDTRKSEDCMDSNDNNKKAPRNESVDACSPTRSEVAFPMLQKSSDYEAKYLAQVKNNLDIHLKLHVAAVNDFQGGIVTTPASTREVGTLLTPDSSAHVSEPIYHSAGLPTTPGRSKDFADCESTSCSGTDLGDRKIGSEKVKSNQRNRPLNHDGNEKLSEQMIGLGESPGVNGRIDIVNAMKNDTLDHAAAISHNLDDQLIEQEEAAVSGGKCESVSREAECTTLEDFDGQGLNQFVSQEALMCSVVNLEVGAQDHIATGGLTVFAEVAPTTICEPTEEDEETKTFTPLHNQETGTTRNTKESGEDDSQNKNGSEDMLVPSILCGNFYLQSPVKGDFAAASGLPKKIEESYAENLRDLACLENSNKQDCLVQNDKLIAEMLLETSKKGAAVSNSNKDVDTGATSDSSECISAESVKIKSFERSSGKTAEALEAGTSPRGDECTSPLLGQANQSSNPGNLISSSDVDNTRNEASDFSSITKEVLLADTREISVRHDDSNTDLGSRSCTSPSGVLQEDVHKICQVQDKSSLMDKEEENHSLEVLPDSFVPQEYENRNTLLPACNVDQAEAKDVVCPIAIKPHSLSRDERVTDEIEEPMQDAALGRCLPLLDDYTGTNNVYVAPKDSAHVEVNDPEDACITRRGNLVHDSPRNLQHSPCVTAEVSDDFMDSGICISEEVELAGDDGNSTKKGWQNVEDKLLVTHLQNVNEADFLIANHHLASESPEVVECSLSGAVGMHFAPGHVEHGENGSPACNTDIEELQTVESMPLEDHDNKVNELGFMGRKLDTFPKKLTITDENTLKASVNDMHDTPGDAGGQKLFEATNIRELGYHVLCSGPFSFITGETNYLHVKENCNADQTDAHGIACPAMAEPQSFVRNEKPIDEIEGAFCDVLEFGCQPLFDHFLGTSEDNASPSECELGELKFSEDAWVTKDNDSGFDRQKDLLSSPGGMDDVSDIVLGHVKLNYSEEVEVDGDIGHEHVKGNYDVDQAVVQDVSNPAMIGFQSFGNNVTALHGTEGAFDDASDVGCAPLLDDPHEAAKDMVAPRESELGQVRNSEDICMTRSNELDSSSSTKDVSDAGIDHGKMDNSEEADARRDQGNSRIGQQHMNGQLDGLLQEEASVTGTDHLEHMNQGQLDGSLQEEASPTGTDHLVYKKKSEDSQSLPCADDGICRVQHNEYKKNSCLADIEERRLYESVAVLDHHNAKGDEPNSIMKTNDEWPCKSEIVVDKKTSEVLMDNIHATTDNSCERNLAEGVSIREMACKELCSSPFSIMNLEANNECALANFDADQAESKDMVYPAMVGHEPNGCGKVTEKIEERLEGTSIIRAYDSDAAGEVDVVLMESEHGEDACMTSSDDLMSERPQDLQSPPCEIGEVADVITEHEKSNNNEVESDADQECEDQKYSVESCMFSSWEIDAIWGNMTGSGNMQQTENEQIVSGKQFADDETLSSPHCKTVAMEERAATGHKVVNEQNEATRADYYNESCPHNAHNLNDFSEIAKRFHANDHSASKVMKSSTIKRKNIRSILIHGTPQKLPLFTHDMKENTQASKLRQMVDVTTVKPMSKRKALEDLRK